MQMSLISTARWRHHTIPLGCSLKKWHLTPDNEPRQTCFRSALQYPLPNRRGVGYVSLKGMGEMKARCLLYSQEGTAHAHSGGRL